MLIMFFSKFKVLILIATFIDLTFETWYTFLNDKKLSFRL